jgi:hypothetical protein
MSSGFSIIVEISRFIELKISKRYMMLYKENMVNEIIKSSGYNDFVNKTNGKYKKITFKYYEDIKRAYVRWTHTEL